MKTTVYTCDKCKQSKSLEDIVTIDISYQITRPNKSRYSARASKDICKTCLGGLGLLTELPETDTEEALKKNDRTLESKFLDLLNDLGVLFEE
jgi:hypothetical protein